MTNAIRFPLKIFGGTNPVGHHGRFSTLSPEIEKISELFRPSIAIARYTHKSFGFSHVSYIVLQAMLRSVWEKRP